MNITLHGLEVSDLSGDPLAFSPPSRSETARALDAMILSASGWRGVLAEDGDEESKTREISEAHRFIVATAALAFSQWLSDDLGRNPVIVVGTDTRPTGPAIADTMIAVFLASGVSLEYLFVAAAPEIMAHAKLTEEVDAFAFVSASHNPIGHNGLKFGRGDGSVLASDESAALRDRFLSLLSEVSYPGTRAKISSMRGFDSNSRSKVYRRLKNAKQSSLASYTRFMEQVATGAAGEVREALRVACAKRPVGVIGELNGSARTVSIDASFLASLGAQTRFLNDEPGNVAHRIVPEGESLEPCRLALERLHRESAEFELGYVPDNDGDRGNLVYFDEETGRARIIHAQEVFALSCVAELSYLMSIDADPATMARTAIVVNGPTSMRIERIAEKFGAEVFRTEVGEAQVVGKAAELRAAGWRAPILGEGSNGGTIIHPASVRDPLSTIAALIRLLRLPSVGSRPSPLEAWSKACGLAAPCEPSVTSLLESLPRFTTTGAYEDRAVMLLAIGDHRLMKAEYERRFPSAWELRRSELEDRFGFVGWRVVNYEGTSEREGIGNRDPKGPHRGGLKVLFSDAAGAERGFIWMRGSATEPVFRILADLEGENPEGEAWLLDWQKEMILETIGGG